MKNEEQTFNHAVAFMHRFWRRLAWLVFCLAISAWLLPLWLVLAMALVWVVYRLWQTQRDMQQFSTWLANPSGVMPEGKGLWAEVLAQVYAVRRREQADKQHWQDSSNLFRNMMKELPDGIVLLNQAGVIEWSNAVAAEHLSLVLPRDIGNRLLNFLRQPDAVALIEQRCVGSPVVVDFNQRYLELQLFDFENERMILVSHDLTERHRIDMMRRDFVANASHELRTPLTVINGFLEHLNERPDLPVAQRQKQLVMMTRQAERMTTLINDMLTLSRLEFNPQPECEMVDMSALLQRQLENARALSGERHQFSSDIQNIPLYAHGGEMEMVIANLLTNAVQYSGDGAHIQLSWTRNENQQAVLTVRDNGRGIAAEHLPRLTERFYRAQSDNKGSGLGLSIVRHILLRHHAELSIHSQTLPHAHHGTTVSVVFKGVQTKVSGSLNKRD